MPQYRRPWHGKPSEPLPRPQPAPVPVKAMLLSVGEPVRDLKRLVELIGQREVERQLDVHRTTVIRWLAGSARIPGAQCIAIRGLLGDLPGTNRRWTGWRFHDGRLLSPGGDAFDPGQVLAINVRNQQNQELQAEVLRLRTRVAVLEALTSESANDAQVA